MLIVQLILPPVIAGCATLGILALGAGACRAVGPDRASGPLRTDRVEYTAAADANPGRYTLTVVAHYTNDTKAPVYLDRCYPDSPPPMYGIRLVGGGTSAYDPMWGCVGHDKPILVQPGAVRTDTLRLTAPNSWDGHTKEPIGTFTGAMQLIYDANSCPAGSGCELPEPLRSSNTFTVRR